MRNRSISLVRFAFSSLLLITAIACERPAARDGEQPPPGGEPVANVPVTPPDDVPPTPPPPVAVPPDPSACPLDDGRVVDCQALLGSADAYCSSVYASEVPDFVLVAGCGSCSATFFLPPAGAEVCGPGGEPAAPPPDGFFDVADSSCKTCHAPQGYDGLHSIENPHAWVTLDCVECHGGDGLATNQTFAHVCPPPQIGNRQQQVLDTRAFFLSFTTAGVQLLDDYSCQTQSGEQRLTRAVEWLAFQNPGDLRSGNEGLGCAKCHGEAAVGPGGEELFRGGNIVAKVRRSVMGNGTGMGSGTRHGIGAPNKFADRRGKTAALDWNSLADIGATAVVNPDYDAADRVVGEVPSLAAPQVFAGEGFRYNNTFSADAVNNSPNVTNANADNYPNGMNNAVAEQIFQEVLNQACTGCHLQNAYNNNRAGDYRTTGCSACHFQTGVSGRSGSTDPNIDKYEPVNPNFLTPGEKTHIQDHRVRNVAKLPGQQEGLFLVVQGIGDNNCLVCHEGSNRTVAQYHGYRLDQNEDLTNGNFYPTQNNVQFSYRTQLYGENQFFNNRQVTQWISTEIWQADVNDVVGQAGQDETPPDVHHAAGMGCIDCHGTGATHGRGQIYSRMKVATHQNDVLCETCHGTIDEYAPNDGTYVLDQGAEPLKHIRVNGNPQSGNFWLVSKLDGSLHYVPQVRDVVNATNGGVGGKTYPPGSSRANQPVYSLVGSYAMGRYQQTQSLADGYGPAQPNSNNQIQMRDGFSHSDGEDGANPAARNRGLECYTCHAAWQNNCVGCHLDAFYDDNPNNFFYSQVTGERIYFNFNANFVYQNPINFMMGINDRGKISVFQGMHRFFSYTDLNNDTSNRISYSDRNGLGNDPALKNPNRNNLPALQNQPYTPHSIRGRHTTTEVGVRGCLDCHLGSANTLIMRDQNNEAWDLTAVYANNYAASAAIRVPESRGLGSNLWLFDANGDAVIDTNNAPAYDLDRIVEANGVSNTGSNHPLLDPFGVDTNPDYLDYNDTNQAHMSRPFTQTLLNKLQLIDNVGLTDVYYHNGVTGQDPNDTGAFTYFLADYNYVGQ